MDFSKDFFINNRRRLLDNSGSDLIVISANGLLQSSADMTFPFKQNANFWYLTGIDEPDIILVITSTEEFLIVPRRDRIKVIFDGDVDKSLLSKTSGINHVMDDKAGWKHLENILKLQKKVGTILPPPSYLRQAGIYTNPAAARLRRRLKTAKSNLSLLDIREDLAGMRIIKQPQELTSIQKAIDITAESFSEVFEGKQKFEWEYQLEAAIESGFRTRGADGPAFPTIVAGGLRACTLHYVSNNFRLKNQELVLIDAGAKFNHYAGDITRTVSLGIPDSRQQEVYRAVLDVQKFAIDWLKPGVLLKDYAINVDNFMGKMLKSLGLIKNNNPKNVRQYFPHAVSHFLGLDVHDGRGWQKPLQAGMVLTVEPGIYINEEAIGVRIEDDILITATGNKVLSAKLRRVLI